MKQIFTFIFTSLLVSNVFSQNGLEGIIVEKYYKSSAQDTVANEDGGILPIGSITYRIYADLLPGYKFQAAYGLQNHELRIETSTLFFNNEDRGDIFPSYTKAQARLHTVMLDSWLSVGAACAGNFGILKNEDYDSLATVQNNYTPQILQNAETSCGIPISNQDGLVLGTPGVMTTVGISNEINVFGNQNDGTNGPVFSTFDGSWACLGGSVGPDSIINKVLIAQITTNGQLKFELNIQIGTPSGNVENYVAKNPTGNEILMESLTYIGDIDTTQSLRDSFSNNSHLINLFPNPINDELRYSIETFNNLSVSAYSIFNIEGKKLDSGLCFNRKKYTGSINCSSFESGFYFIVFQTENGPVSKKFIKN
jgi:hypothetical protein